MQHCSSARKIAILAASQVAVTALSSAWAAPVLLEDFSASRNNGSGTPLWEAYNGENPGQTYSLTNGMFQINGTGDGPYVQFMPYSSGYPFPNGFAQRYIKSGAFDPNTNRLRFKAMCNKSVTRRSDGGDILQFGTYIKSHTNSDNAWQGAHYYHLFDPNVYANKWMVVTVTSLPQHQVGGGGATNWPLDPEFASAGVHYFDGLKLSRHLLPRRFHVRHGNRRS